MVSTNKVLWTATLGWMGLGVAVELGGFVIPSPLDAIVDYPVDMVLVGLGIMGLMFA